MLYMQQTSIHDGSKRQFQQSSSMQNKEFTGFTEVGMVLKGAQIIQSLPHHRAAHPPMSDVGCKPGLCTSIHQLQTAWGVSSP